MKLFMHTYTHLFFDLDRTLWDYESNSLAAFKDIFQELKLESISSPELFKQKYDYHNELLWEQYRKEEISKDFLSIERFCRTLGEFNIEDRTLAAEIGKKYIEIIPTKPHLVPGCRETLEYLKDKGYELNIITNGFVEIQVIKLKSSKINDFFSSVITSDEVGYQKPRKEIFEFSLKTCNAHKEQSIMIGDDFVSDIEGAASFGIDQVFYQIPGNTDIISFQPTYIINNIAELKTILQKATSV